MEYGVDNIAAFRYRQMRIPSGCGTYIGVFGQEEEPFCIIRLPWTEYESLGF